ncbi:hypothetical protein GCM10028801_44080 [Nocardioides maradonensis]
MSENPSDIAASSTDDPAPVAAPAPPTPPSDPAPPAAPRLRDRVFRLRAVLAVAAAGVIVGGATGAGLTAVTGGHGDGRSQPGRLGFGSGQGPGMPGGMPGMPGVPGQGVPGQGFSGQGFSGLPGQQPGSTTSS